MDSAIPLIFVSMAIGILGQYCLKNGMNSIGEVSANSLLTISGLLKLFTNLTVLSGFLFYALAAILWLVVLSKVDLSFAYPFIGLTHVIVLIMSQYALKEAVSPMRWLGALVVFAGIVIIART